jgi:hypothetical protein
VAARKAWHCHLCRRAIDPAATPGSALALSLDHIVPVSHGGTDAFKNLAPAHVWCNTRRGDVTVAEARQLLKAPEQVAVLDRHFAAARRIAEATPETLEQVAPDGLTKHVPEEARARAPTGLREGDP